MEELLTLIGDGQPSSAVILAVLAVGLGKILEKFLNKHHVKFEESMVLRKQCRDDIDILRAELGKFRIEVDEWREKYWEQINKNSNLQTNINSLQFQVETLRAEVSHYEQTLNTKLSAKVTEFFQLGDSE